MKVIKRFLIYEIMLLLFTGIIYFEFSYMISDVSGECDFFVSEAVEIQRPIVQANIILDHQVLMVEETISLIKPEKEIWLNIPASLYGKVEISDIFHRNYKIEMQNNDAAMRITFPEKSDSIRLKYKIHLENKRSILSYHEDTVLLTEFLITTAPYVADRPILSEKSTFGDPFVYPMQDYKITLQVASDYTAFAPGKVSESITDQQKTVVFHAREVRDFPLVLQKNPMVTRDEIRDIDVTYVGMTDVHQEVVRAFDYIERKTGEYPYKELFVVAAPIDLQGMEFSQMIFISDQIQNNKRVLNKIIYHEIFHQWFYGMVGTNQMDEPFMDEGLVCFMAADLAGEKRSKSYNKDMYHLSLTSYKSKNEYYRFAYNDAATFYSSLSEKYGTQFDEMIKAIFIKYKGKILTKQNLMDEVLLLKNGDD